MVQAGPHEDHEWSAYLLNQKRYTNPTLPSNVCVYEILPPLAATHDWAPPNGVCFFFFLEESSQEL